jgi:hypothetical protein
MFIRDIDETFFVVPLAGFMKWVGSILFFLILWNSLRRIIYMCVYIYVYIYIYIFFWQHWIWTQGFTLARRVFYYLSYTSSPKSWCFLKFWKIQQWSHLLLGFPWDTFLTDLK